MMEELQQRSLRRTDPIVYTVSDNSDSESPPSPSPTPFETPEKSKRSQVVDLIEDDDDIDELALDTSPPPRLTSAGHSLRRLRLTVKAKENKVVSMVKSRRRRKKTRAKPRSDPMHTTNVTARIEIRNSIATRTASMRYNFLAAKKDYFLPLLPADNQIHKLIEKLSLNGEVVSFHEYVELDEQPKGVTAIMKPYQISGLSFLVYLHKNGLSGILGDEMGLGKTLQTLALFQYLKEQRKFSTQTEADENRPSLVVCPLSVLSSWIAESKKWTPGLKVLRLHGPLQERNRLKKVAEGIEDQFRNETALAKRRRHDRRVKRGKSVISLISDEEEEIEEIPVDVVVTTYDTFHQEQSWFKRAFVWRYVVLDEGHKIKNDSSQVSEALQSIGAEYRLMLTGTPLQNNLAELWALLHWLYPEVFTTRTSDLFKKSFDLNRGKVDTSVMDHARRLLELIMLRRMKNSPCVDLNLPPKTETLLFVPLSQMQRVWYTRLLTKVDQGLLEDVFRGSLEKEKHVRAQELEEAQIWNAEGRREEVDGGGEDSRESPQILKQGLGQEKPAEKKSDWQKLMNLLMQLRKCCNHPYLIHNAAPEPYYLGDHVVHASGKFVVLEKLIQELVVKQGRKVLIFSGFTGMLDLCEDLLALQGGAGERFRYSRLDGSTARARRNLSIRLFNTYRDQKVMLISTRAGGLGINLTSASDVVFLDSDWNPQITLQAEARAHRIGQTKPVTVYKICSQGTVEEQMIGRIQKKLYLSAKVTESMRNIHTKRKSRGSKTHNSDLGPDDSMPQLDTSQLMSLVRRGAQVLSHAEIGVTEMLSWDWDTTLEKCKDKCSDLNASEESQGSSTSTDEDEKAWLSKVEHVETAIFDGKKYAKSQPAHVQEDIFVEYSRADRRKGKNTTVMLDGYAVSKESMQCGDWEAVPTYAGKDPRLAEPKRAKKAPIVNQDICLVCYDGGELYTCSSCPRSYHFGCLDRHFQGKALSPMQFNCPQHQCFDCQQKTTDAGGLIYRCRWCERGYCEDCLDWDETQLIGDSLVEFELVGYSAMTQAYYISCPSCNRQDPEILAFRSSLAERYDQSYQEMAATEAARVAEQEEEMKRLAMEPPSRAESMTDATTLNDSGLTTPAFEELPDTLFPRTKRTAAMVSLASTPEKKRTRLSSRLGQSC